MPRLFGTDGIRGTANVDLKPTLGVRAGPRHGSSSRGPGPAYRRRTGHAPLRRHVRGGDRGGATSMGVDVHASESCPRRPWPSSPVRAISRRGSWSRPRTTRPATTASRSRRNGLKLDEKSRMNWSNSSGRAEELPGAPPDALGRRSRTVSVRPLPRHRLRLARQLRAIPSGRGLRQRLRRHGRGTHPLGHRRSRRRPVQRPGRLEHQRRLRRHRAHGPGRGSLDARSGRRLRPGWRRRPAHCR